MSAVQLSLFGESSDQNFFSSEKWGLLEFVETHSTKWCDNCRHCLLWVQKPLQSPDDECLTAHCSKEDRQDGKDGYFSIQEAPRT